MMKDRNRAEARGKGLLCAQGIEVGGLWWEGKGWAELQSDPRLKDWMKEQLEDWREKILSAQGEQRALRERIEALAPERLPKGVGAYSAAVLIYEMKGWERFSNRRQVASYTGLCPGIHLSDGRGKEGSINRCGNPTVRWTFGRDGLAPDEVAAPLWPGTSTGQWSGQKQACQKTPGSDGRTAFGH
jgi:transposase